jgi:uncharacterized protein (DUF983 family)
MEQAMNLTAAVVGLLGVGTVVAVFFADRWPMWQRAAIALSGLLLAFLAISRL